MPHPHPNGFDHMSSPVFFEALNFLLCMMIPLSFFTKTQTQFSSLIAIETIALTIICIASKLYIISIFLGITGLLIAFFFPLFNFERRLTNASHRSRRIYYLFLCIVLFFGWRYFSIALLPPISSPSVSSSPNQPTELFRVFHLLFSTFSIELALISFLILLFSLFIFRIRRAKLAVEGQAQK